MDKCYEYYDDFIECRYNVWLWRTVFTLLLLFGTFGNIMNVIILLRKRLRQFPTTVHLISLAVADLCTLWSYLFSFILLNGFGIEIRTMSRLICKIFDFIIYTSGGFSIWTVVALTVKRLMLTRYPLFSRSKLTRKTALITSLVCFGVVAALLIHMPFSYEIQISDNSNEDGKVWQKSCTRTELEDFNTKILLVYILFLFNLIPIAILLLANGVIIATLVSQRKRLCTVNPREHVNQPNRQKQIKSSTRLILGINMFFILTTLPFLVRRVIQSQTMPSTEAQDLAKQALYESAFKFVFCCNYAFNFILYCVTGTIFYEELTSFLGESKQTLLNLFAFRMRSSIPRSDNFVTTSTAQICQQKTTEL